METYIISPEDLDTLDRLAHELNHPDLADMAARVRRSRAELIVVNDGTHPITLGAGRYVLSRLAE
jgi:hypothetical protein